MSSSPSYRTILVPHDGSKPSDRALDYAITIASRVEGSEIVLLYVVPELHLPLSKYTLRLPSNRGVREDLEKFYREVSRDAEEMLEVRKKRCESSGVRARAAVLRGHPSDQIVRFAAKERADLVVAGSTGRSGISRIRTLGSVARNVSEKSPCPVMLVH